MNLKDELIKLKKILTNREGSYNPTEIKLLEKSNKEVVPISLNSKIEEFINSGYVDSKIARNLIEKFAVWYELRYSDEDIENMLKTDDSTCKTSVTSEKMFVNNPYIKDNFDDANRIKQSEFGNLKWEDFYNKEVFINSLTNKEQIVLNPVYNTFINIGDCRYHFHLTPDGFVTSDEVWLSASFGFEDMHIKEVLIQLEQRKDELLGLNITKANMICNSLYDEVRKYDKKVFIKEQILTCAMYKIIERGYGIEGSYRAFLFAKEFGLNIDIPIMYMRGDRITDVIKKMNFIEQYLESGGNRNLICYNNYSSEKTTTFLLNDKLEDKRIMKKVLRGIEEINKHFE